jgi:7-cyano-7-deazaguanine synthase
MTRCLVLSSGGSDSSVAVGLAVSEFKAHNVGSISISYGQKHEKELISARLIADHYEIKHVEVGLPAFLQGSALTDGAIEVPKGSYTDLVENGPISTYVPFRNGILLSIAIATAYQRYYNLVYWGAHAEDGDRFAYPDCTVEFSGAMANAAWVGTAGKVRLWTPFQYLRKKDIVKLGAELNVPFEKTWSCYVGSELACGKCPTCISRLEAFANNGLEDPILY